MKKLALGVMLAGSVGCVGANNASLSTVVEALEGARPSSPFVEAHIQYVGPEARWAGPVLWTVHVVAREGSPVFEVIPALPRAKGQTAAPEVSNRAPASALGLTQIPEGQVARQEAKGFTLEQVRERLAHLASVVTAGDKETQACSTVIKVRLSRADGSVVENQGCRASNNWSQTVSEVATEFMTASTVAVVAPVAPATAPVSAPAEAKPAAHGDHG